MSPFVTVYRVEHREDRTGPFRGKHYADWHQLDVNGMPMLSSDRLTDGLFVTVVDERTTSRYVGLPGTAHEDDWLFAFPSVEVMRRWVSENDCMILAGAGFVLRHYRVSRGAAIIREQQVTFDPTVAVEVGEEPLYAQE